MSDLSWRVYERVAAAFEVEAGSLDCSVTSNARIIGAITGVERQVDVLIDLRWGDDEISRRTIVDAKNYASKLDVKDVESFEGMMKDCRASRGVLVCPNGYSPAALRRAQDAITIKLLTLDEVDEFDWAHYEPCQGDCLERPNPQDRGLVLWDGQHPVGIAGDGILGGWAIVFTGKCDRCHNFHVLCWDCGLRFALPDEGEFECGCDERQWVTAIEEEAEDPTGQTLNAIHLFMVLAGQAYALDRRRLR